MLRSAADDLDLTDCRCGAAVIVAGGALTMSSKSLRTEKTYRNKPQENIAVFPASMTVEAALVLPLFLFCIFNILFLLDAVRLQSRVAAALQPTGDQICEYA